MSRANSTQAILNASSKTSQVAGSKLVGAAGDENGNGKVDDMISLFFRVSGSFCFYRPRQSARRRKVHVVHAGYSGLVVVVVELDVCSLGLDWEGLVDGPLTVVPRTTCNGLCTVAAMDAMRWSSC